VRYSILIITILSLTISITVFSEEKIEFKAPLLVAKDTVTNAHLATSTGAGVSIGITKDTHEDSKLDVSGAAIIGSNYVGEGGSAIVPADGLLIEGTVGIGTNAPDQSYKLDVSGDMHASGGMVVDDSVGIGMTPTDEDAQLTVYSENQTFNKYYYTVAGDYETKFDWDTPACPCEKGSDMRECSLNQYVWENIGEKCVDNYGYCWCGDENPIPCDTLSSCTAFMGGGKGNRHIYFYRGDDPVSESTIAFNVKKGRSIFSDAVGIGVAEPEEKYKLDVDGDINFTGKLYQNGTEVDIGDQQHWLGSIGNDGEPDGGIYNLNNVGIGTDQPRWGRLTISQADGSYGLTVLSSDGGKRFALQPMADGTWTLYDGAKTDIEVAQELGGGAFVGAHVWTAGITQKKGNVGIGTTDPEEALEVNGNLKVVGKIKSTGGPGIYSCGGTLSLNSTAKYCPNCKKWYATCSGAKDTDCELIGRLVEDPSLEDSSE
jgi:hypothetical protein